MGQRFCRDKMVNQSGANLNVLGSRRSFSRCCRRRRRAQSDMEQIRHSSQSGEILAFGLELRVVIAQQLALTAVSRDEPVHVVREFDDRAR